MLRDKETEARSQASDLLIDLTKGRILDVVKYRARESKEGRVFHRVKTRAPAPPAEKFVWEKDVEVYETWMEDGSADDLDVIELS